MYSPLNVIQRWENKRNVVINLPMSYLLQNVKIVEIVSDDGNSSSLMKEHKIFVNFCFMLVILHVSGNTNLFYLFIYYTLMCFFGLRFAALDNKTL